MAISFFWSEAMAGITTEMLAAMMDDQFNKLRSAALKDKTELKETLLHSVGSALSEQAATCDKKKELKARTSPAEELIVEQVKRITWQNEDMCRLVEDLFLWLENQ